MYSDAPVIAPWMKWVVLAHFSLIVGGIFMEFWVFLPFCLWTESRAFQTPGQIVWLVLSLSPFLGLIALKTERMHWPYLVLAAATPLFAITVLLLNHLGVMQCDAP